MRIESRFFTCALVLATSAAGVAWGCSDSGTGPDSFAPGDGDGGGDAPSTSSTDGGGGGDGGNSATWESVEPISDDGTVIAEKVSYRSQGLKIYGLLCRPKKPGAHKALVMNHGGFAGVGGWNAQSCAAAVKNDYVVVQSSYRGEDGSEGRIEVCLGEVDDVLAIVEITRALPYVAPNKVTMLGASHGGCITTRAVQRGAKVQAAVDVFGPKDWAADFAFWKGMKDADAGAAFYEGLMRVVREGTGGTPEEKPDEYVKRSPIHFVADLDAFPAPYMTVHGTKDALVLARDTCRLAAAAKDVKSYHVDKNLAVVTTEPPGCEGTGVTWLGGPKPAPSWPAPRYAVVYDEAGHEIQSTSGATMYLDGLQYIVAKVP